MKLPHVTIEYREEESYAIGKMSPELVVGFGLHWAWMYLCMYNGHDLFQTGDETYSNTFFMTSLAVFACTLVAYAAFLKHIRMIFATPYHRQRNRLIGACCMFAGMVILIFVSGPDTLSTVLSMVSGTLTGFGSAIILMSFSVSFSVLDVTTSSVCAALALLVASGIYAVVAILQSFVAPAGMILCMMLPFAEVFCLMHCSTQLVDKLTFAMSTIPVRSKAFSLRLGFPFLIMGFAIGFVRGEVFGMGGSLASTSNFSLSILLAGVFAYALIMAALLTQRQTSYYMFRTLFPVIAVLLGLSVTPLGNDVAFSIFSSLTSYFLLETCVWVTLADISQRFRISAFTVFGIGRGMLAIGTFAAIIAGNSFPVDSFMGGESSLPIVLILILLLFVYSLMPTNAEIRSTLIYGSVCPGFLDRDEIADPAQQKHEAQPLVSPDSQDLTSQTSKETHTDNTAPKSSSDEVIQEDDPLAPERLGRFKRKCLTIADTYLLSRKETEVLFLLAKGYNSSAIQKSLYISAGTVNTHMRNIYRKLDVHSQQELIATVESVDETS